MSQSKVETCLIRGSFQPDTRPDRPPAPECERVHMQARLADGAATRTARPTGGSHERSPACRAATVERQPEAAVFP
jgi:hypothetical protein